MSLPVRKLTDDFWIAPQLGPDDMDALATSGARGLIVLRPDDEAPDHPGHADLTAAAAAYGIQTVYIPVPLSGPAPEDAVAFQGALATLPGPVVGMCRSGARAQFLWKAVGAGDSAPGLLARIRARVFGG